MGSYKNHVFHEACRKGACIFEDQYHGCCQGPAWSEIGAINRMKLRIMGAHRFHAQKAKSKWLSAAIRWLKGSWHVRVHVFSSDTPNANGDVFTDECMNKMAASMIGKKIMDVKGKIVGTISNVSFGIDREAHNYVSKNAPEEPCPK